MAFRIRAGIGALSMFGASLNAQSVLLQIKPKLGDTLWVKLAQQVEMTGVPQGCGNPTSSLRAQSKTPASTCTDARSMTTGMEVFSRAIARHTNRSTTDILAITDSVVTISPGPSPKRLKQPTPRGPVEIRISTDGSVELGAGHASDDLRALFGQMPATLPKKPISVGERWLHQQRGTHSAQRNLRLQPAAIRLRLEAHHAPSREQAKARAVCVHAEPGAGVMEYWNGGVMGVSDIRLETQIPILVRLSLVLTPPSFTPILSHLSLGEERDLCVSFKLAHGDFNPAQRQ